MTFHDIYGNFKFFFNPCLKGEKR